MTATAHEMIWNEFFIGKRYQVVKGACEVDDNLLKLSQFNATIINLKSRLSIFGFLSPMLQTFCTLNHNHWRPAGFEFWALGFV